MFYPESSPVIYIAKFSVTNPLKAPKVSVQLGHHTMCLFEKSGLDSNNTSEVRSAVVESMSPVSSVSAGISKQDPLPTRCLGRVSSRAIKRRNNFTPRTPPARKPKVKAVVPLPQSSGSGAPERPAEACTMAPSEADTRKNFFLTTDRAYYLPDNQIQPLTPSPLRNTDVPVPSWERKIVKDSHRMERTEDTNDSVFLSRHKKSELFEIRSKKWELQKLRQQNATKKPTKAEKIRKRKSKNSVQQESQTFYIDPCNIEYIEITKELPVMAFGHPIPYFQPCEFSLPWCCDRSLSTDSLCVPKAKRGRPSVT